MKDEDSPSSESDENENESDNNKVYHKMKQKLHKLKGEMGATDLKGFFDRQESSRTGETNNDNDQKRQHTD